MSYNTPPSQSEYISINNFNQYPADPQQLQGAPVSLQQQQQVPVSPPPFNSPLIYESSGSGSGGSSSSGSSLDIDTLKYKNDICKSFEDDLFYCPRSLLSAQEQLTCERVDLFMSEQLREFQQQQHSSINPSSSPKLGLQRPKFNPYTSQSFSPAPTASGNGLVK